ENSSESGERPGDSTMAAAALLRKPKAPARFLTLADVLDHLGGIPAFRVRMNPPPGLATEADLIAHDRAKGRICELIDGVLVEKDVAVYESWLASVLIHFVLLHVRKNDLGIVLGEGAYLRLFPGQIRVPDVSFVSW